MLCLLCSIVSFHNWGGVVPTLRIPSLWVSWRQIEFSWSTARSGPAYLWFYLLWPKGCFPTKIDKKVFEKSTLWIIPFFFLCWWGSWHFCAKYQLVTLLPFPVHLSCLQYFDLFSLNVKKKSLPSKTLSHTRGWFDFKFLGRIFFSQHWWRALWTSYS